MERQRIILVSGSRLLKEMLKRIFQKTEYLQVVQVIDGDTDIPAPDRPLDADWVIEALPLPQILSNWVKHYKQTHPHTSSLRVAADSNLVQVMHKGKKVSMPGDISLPALLNLLQGNGDAG